MTRSLGTFALSVAFTVGCGGDSGTNFDGHSSTGGNQETGGGSHADAAAGTGGRGTGGNKETGGAAVDASGTGGAVGTGGSSGDASAAGGTDSGAAGAGGSAAGAGGSAGAGGAGGAGGKKANGQPCGTGTECTSGNCVGGACCGVACNTPGACEQLAGTKCLNGDTCQYGLKLDKTSCDTGDKCVKASSCFNGQCQVDQVVDCSDGNACTEDVCNPSTGACSHPATNCDDKNPCTTDTCDMTKGCQHADNNAAACTDNNPCTTDACSGGVCVSKPKDCSTLTDDCNKGVCVSGVCQAQPANSGAACNIAADLTSCDVAGTCNASGTCVGDDAACGAQSTACTTPCSGGGTCQNNRVCTCKTNYVESGGVCVPQTNECALSPSPCVTNATCKDPSSATGDVVCTCPKGYTGNGKTAAAGGNGCTDIDECTSGTPCGTGGTCTNTPGSYTCTCAAGFKMIATATGQTCVCDMTGTYGLTVKSNVTWTSPNPAIEASPSGGVPIYSWTLRYNTIAADGTMTSTTIPCGGTSPTFCDTAFSFAHAQYQPDETWGKKKINDGFPPFTMSLAGVVPGGKYNEPQTVSLQGIALDNPAGAWPPCAACVGVAAGGTCTCGGNTVTVTNHATWVDADGDSHLGFTTDTVPRGGQSIGNPYSIDSSAADPPFDYTEPSECPRIAQPTGTYGYAEFPGLDGIIPFRAYRWYVASRVISAYQSTSIALSNNQCVITGNVTGPDSGKPHGDARIQGCETCGGTNTCTPAGPCSQSQAASYDTLSQTQSFVSTTFTLKNVTASINLGPILSMADGAAKESALNQACQELRAQSCPAGKTCQ